MREKMIDGSRGREKIGENCVRRKRTSEREGAKSKIASKNWRKARESCQTDGNRPVLANREK